MKQIIKITLLVLAVDAVVNALPGAYSFYRADEYLPEFERGPIKNFFKALSFHSIIYIMMVFHVHVGLSLLYVLIIRQINSGIITELFLGVIISSSAYLWYAYHYSVDWSFGYFPYKIFWYAVLGLLYGLLYHQKVTLKRNH